MSWEGQVYVDKVLPFGLRSAPQTLQRSGRCPAVDPGKFRWGRGSPLFDNFLLFCVPDSGQCEQALHIALARCRSLGVPVASRKTEGPTTTLTFLGIELDTLSLTVCLPLSKLERLHKEIRR